MSGSGAIILAGAPRIGKSGLVHYLQDTLHPEWSWRKEIASREAGKGLHLEKKHFVQVNLRSLKTAEKVDELFGLFVTQCALALQKIYQPDTLVSPTDLKGLREVLRSLNQSHPDTQYFLMLDSIERLDRADLLVPGLEMKDDRTATERGLALLNECKAIRVLIDLIDDFSNISVILSIESLPGPTGADQFTHVSADLARFLTMPLQAFSWDDTKQYLAQEVQDFDHHWAQQFRDLGGEHIFTPGEQAWILEQAGTHPYLLQQFCFNTFDFKKVYASMYGWTELQENDKGQIIEVVTERISTFLSGLRKRLQEAMGKGGPEVQDKFNEFIDLLTSKQTHKNLPYERWQRLGAEMHYILRSEGIIRYDRFQPIHLPGAILCKYLMQQGSGKSPNTTRNFQLTISYPGKEKEQLILSELEYGLIKTLMQHPRQCQEIELMKGAWGKPVGHSTFTQRMYHLRKKLEDVSEGTEVIANQYGGLYSLNHPEWLNVE